MRPQRGISFGVRGDGFHDFDIPMSRGSRPPFGMFIARNADCLPGRMRGLNLDPACDPRGSFQPFQAGRGRDQTRIMEVGDEGQLPVSRFGRGREGFYGYEESYNQDRQRQTEPRPSAFPPMNPTNDRYGDSNMRGRQLEGPRRPSTPGVDRYRDWNPRAGTAREKALPFGKAMKWMHEELKSAEPFYSKFMKDYENEIKRITYASKDVKIQIWYERVAGKKVSAEVQYGDEYGGQSGGQDKGGEKFADKQKSLREAMEAALNASLKLGDDDTPKVATIEARRRLQEKVELGSYQIMGLISSSMKASEHCKILVDELRQLTVLVDAAKHKNWFGEGAGGNGGDGHEGNDCSNDNHDDYDDNEGDDDNGQ